MIQVNLIPDIKIQVIKARASRTKAIVISIIISLVFVGVTILLALYTFAVQTVVDSNLNNQISSEVDKFNSVEDISKLLTIQNQLKTIPLTHSSKNLTSRSFSILSPVITASGGLTNISNTNIDLDTNTMNITGSTPNYATFESFLKSLQSCYVQYTTEKNSTDLIKKGLVISFVSGQATSGKDPYGNNSVNFVFSINYPSEIFLPTSYNVNFGIDKSGNVSDSFNGIPSSVINRKGA